jgi:hypothetical protein
MYVAPNGERIHPVHVRLDFTQKRRADVWKTWRFPSSCTQSRDLVKVSPE